MSPSVDQSYRVCEGIARREAKNFYYSFLVLPRHKRSAMCAMYAFMRHADDLADDESIPLEQRRLQATAWLKDWHGVAAGGVTENPVFIAVRDVQQRFEIPTELLDQLVQGTMMDLFPPQNTQLSATQTSDLQTASPYLVYRTFDDLYQYCYYVASVVGLVCIRIFGYSDPCAEKLAEETGIAFQLTNILRDVREDAERGRVYLPVEDLQSYNLTVTQLAATKSTGPLPENTRLLMEMEAQRAEKFYASANVLLPMIAADSRPALWVLVTVYHRLLQRIVENRYQVFVGKIKISTREKIGILLRGMGKVLLARLFRVA